MTISQTDHLPDADLGSLGLWVSGRAGGLPAAVKPAG